ncbi:hypothetical protein ID875_21395 [Streptomyces globisporus]|uniref:Uncharacterized protein n=1 Tax=Streptomyces globisporus TaxID=1908 RepID=A0A927GNT6_STRGL|nr:hypothetical protein [Streptomyces globisporus]
MRVVEAAALHAAAKGVLAGLPVPSGLSAQARAGWRAARAAAVLALVAEAERTMPPPPLDALVAVSGPGGGERWTLDWGAGAAGAVRAAGEPSRGCEATTKP